MDIERAKNLKQSLDWAAICEELDMWISVEFNKLRSCNPEELKNIQLKIQILEDVKSLPQIVIDRVE